MVWKKVGWQTKKAKPKRFKTLRMMKRGWTQPDAEMKKRLTEVAIRKALTSVKAIEDPMKMAIQKALVVAPESRGMERERAIMREFMAEVAHLGKKQQRIALGVVSKAAIKYALDAAGIADRKKRIQVRALMKEAMETMLLSTDAFSKRHSVEVLLKAQRLLGVRGALFIRRYIGVSEALLKELEKSGVFSGG